MFSERTLNCLQNGKTKGRGIRPSHLADSIMVLYFGKIITRGTPKEISEDPKVREIYLGSEDGDVSA